MFKRYLSVFKYHVILIIVLIALIIASTVTKGTFSSYTSVFTGIVMIYAAIVFTIWIIRTPSKKNPDEGL